MSETQCRIVAHEWCMRALISLLWLARFLSHNLLQSCLQQLGWFLQTACSSSVSTQQMKTRPRRLKSYCMKDKRVDWQQQGRHTRDLYVAGFEIVGVSSMFYSKMMQVLWSDFLFNIISDDFSHFWLFLDCFGCSLRNFGKFQLLQIFLARVLSNVPEVLIQDKVIPHLMDCLI